MKDGHCDLDMRRYLQNEKNPTNHNIVFLGRFYWTFSLYTFIYISVLNFELLLWSQYWSERHGFGNLEYSLDIQECCKY